ncbi:MAG: methionine--tRNA ligase [Thermoplasmata archaeon]
MIGMERIFIGVAWPYANGPLHLGHVAGSLLPPDIFARYHRMKGNDVLMVSGSDEHGTPITVQADQEGVHPKDVVDRYHKINSECLKKLGISFDLFTHTSTQNHREVVHDFFLTLLKKGYIYKKSVTALYCEKCKKFLPDRYVEGTCPHCSFEGARGDQCEKCGKLLDPEDLKNPMCKLCKSEPKKQETEQFFFKLSAFRDKLLEYIEDKNYWRENTKAFTKNWLVSGLKDRAITRDISWGVDIPVDGYAGKRIYVWFEAVIGYLSASKEWAKLQNKPERWKDFWHDKKTKGYYFLGKDNIPFHTIIWPAMLMGYGGLNLPYDVPANEYLTLKGEQFSKSRRHAIWLPEYLERYAPDPVRYYLSINMPDTKDVDFTWEDFVRKNNDELVGTLGNFINRVLMFTHKNFVTVPPLHKLEGKDKEALEMIEKTYADVDALIAKCEFKRAMKEITTLSHFGDGYINEKAPWKDIKENKARCETTMHVCLRIVKALAVLSAPFLPFSADKTWNMLGYDGSVHQQKWDAGKEDIKQGQKLRTPLPLFEKLEIKDVLEKEGAAQIKDAPKTGIRIKEKDVSKVVAHKKEKETSKIDTSVKEKDAAKIELHKKETEMENIVTIDEFSKVDIRVGEIVEVNDHPDADKLYIMLVDIGTEKRQLVAGLKKYYKKEELLGKKAMIVANLQPAKIRGIDSNGMILAADDGKGKISLIVPDKDIEKGSKAR